MEKSALRECGSRCRQVRVGHEKGGANKMSRLVDCSNRQMAVLISFGCRNWPSPKSYYSSKAIVNRHVRCLENNNILFVISSVVVIVFVKLVFTYTTEIAISSLFLSLSLSLSIYIYMWFFFTLFPLRFPSYSWFLFLFFLLLLFHRLIVLLRIFLLLLFNFFSSSLSFFLSCSFFYFRFTLFSLNSSSFLHTWFFWVNPLPHFSLL